MKTNPRVGSYYLLGAGTLMGVAWASLPLGYPLLMEAYFKQAPNIPDGSLTELHFEDLEAKPMETIRRVYHDLDIPAYDQAAPSIKAYLERIKAYAKNPHDLPEDEKNTVKREWAPWFDKLGYTR